MDKKPTTTKMISMIKVYLDTYDVQINLFFSSLSYTNLVIKECLKRLLNARSSAFAFFLYECSVCSSIRKMSIFIYVHLLSSYIFYASEAPSEAFVAVRIGWNDIWTGEGTSL